MLKAILFGGGPVFSNLAPMRGEILPAEGRAMATLIGGRPGSGKTVFLADHLVGCAKRFPEQTILMMDPSGALTDGFLTITLAQPPEDRERILGRVVYDKLGDKRYVLPLPEFSHLYGTTYEEQVQRVKSNFEDLQPQLVKDAPVLGGLGVRELIPQICRLLTTIRDQNGHIWQMSEATRLLNDTRLLRQALAQFGPLIPRTMEYLQNNYVGISPHEQAMRRYAPVSILDALEPAPIKARLGYAEPGCTPRKAVREGLIWIVDGAGMADYPDSLDYAMTQVHSLFMAEINKRRPNDPNDKPVSLVIDEVFSLLQTPGMAEKIGRISTLYRSRKVQLYIVIQALWQLSKELKEQIWSMGNIVCFGIENFDDAYAFSQQLIRYDARAVKAERRSRAQMPVFEPDRGQYLRGANWIQNLKDRECIVKRYLSEKEKDRYLRHVPRTPEAQMGQVTPEMLEETKEQLLKARGVRIEDVLELINRRSLPGLPKGQEKRRPKVE